MSPILRYLRFERRASDNSWLDLARMLAIALVLLRHGQRAIDPDLQETPSWLGTVFLNGWVGVDLFFVLSGYLIAAHLIRRRAQTASLDLRRYFSARALRVVPAYFAMIGLIVAGAFPLYPVAGEALGLRVAYHLLFLQDYLPSKLNVAFWSLGVEEKFYLVAPLLVWLCLSRRSLWQKLALLGGLAMLATALRAAAFAAMPETVDYQIFFAQLRSPFHLCLEPLLAGVAVAIVHAHRAMPPAARRPVRAIAAAAAALLLWLAAENFMAAIGWRDVVLQPMLLAALFGLLVHGAVLLARRPLPFEPVVRVVARLSYTLYLTHMPMIPLALALAGPTAGSGEGRVARFWLAYLLLSAGAALALHYLVEKPFLLVKSRLDHGQTAARDDPARAVRTPEKLRAPAPGGFAGAAQDARS